MGEACLSSLLVLMVASKKGRREASREVEAVGGRRVRAQERGRGRAGRQGAAGRGRQRQPVVVVILLVERTWLGAPERGGGERRKLEVAARSEVSGEPRTRHRLRRPLAMRKSWGRKMAVSHVSGTLSSERAFGLSLTRGRYWRGPLIQGRILDCRTCVCLAFFLLRYKHKIVESPAT